MKTEDVRAWLAAGGATKIELNHETGDHALVTFETNRTALDIVQHNDEPQYTLVYHDQDEDRGIYAETLFFSLPPTAAQNGYLVEGLYRRPIEYKGEPEATFEGTIAAIDDPASWDDALTEAMRRYDRRTLAEHLAFVRYDLLNMGRLRSRLAGDPQSASLIAEFDGLMRDALRTAAGMREC